MSVRTPQVVGDAYTYSWQRRLAADKRNSEILSFLSRKQARKSSPRRSAIKLVGLNQGCQIDCFRKHL